MTKDSFIQQMNSLLKLIRTEYGLTQDEMAVIMGISKKTLVESEKGRRSLGWTECVALASLFAQSHVLQNSFGGDVSDMLSALAFSHVSVRYPQTMGGKVWWRTVEKSNGYRIQQNIISQHYRLLNADDCRLISSFDLEEIRDYLRILQKRKG